MQFLRANDKSQTWGGLALIKVDGKAGADPRVLWCCSACITGGGGDLEVEDDMSAGKGRGGRRHSKQPDRNSAPSSRAATSKSKAGHRKVPAVEPSAGFFGCGGGGGSRSSKVVPVDDEDE